MVAAAGNRRTGAAAAFGLTLGIALGVVMLVAPSAAPAAPVDAASAPADATLPNSARKPPVLRGTVGPGFEITVSQNPVPAGRYRVKVRDRSEMHNWHLYGRGVDVESSVPEQGKYVWTVRLRKGTYTIECDPHPVSMHIDLQVTRRDDR